LSSLPGPSSAEDQWQTVRARKGKRAQKRKSEPEDKGTAGRTDVEDAADKDLKRSARSSVLEETEIVTQLGQMEDEEDAVPEVTDHGKFLLPDALKDLLRSEQKDGSSMNKPGMVMKNDSVASPDLSESNETETSVANTVHPDKPTTIEIRIHQTQ